MPPIHLAWIEYIVLTFQYNYSQDNDGGFILICTPGNSYSRDAVVRCNISQNDGLNSASVFHFGDE